jgi:chromosome segregation ATPase
MMNLQKGLDKISEFVITLGSVEKLKIDLRSTVMSSAEELIREINNEIDESSVAVNTISDQIDEMSSAKETLENDVTELEDVLSTLDSIDYKLNEVRASRSSAEQWIQ